MAAAVEFAAMYELLVRDYARHRHVRTAKKGVDLPVEKRGEFIRQRRGCRRRHRRWRTLYTPIPKHVRLCESEISREPAPERAGIHPRKARDGIKCAVENAIPKSSYLT